MCIREYVTTYVYKIINAENETSIKYICKVWSAHCTESWWSSQGWIWLSPSKRQWNIALSMSLDTWTESSTNDNFIPSSEFMVFPFNDLSLKIDSAENLFIQIKFIELLYFPKYEKEQDLVKVSGFTGQTFSPIITPLCRIFDWHCNSN